MKKNILFIVPTLHGGGAEKVLIDILKNFDEDNYTIDLLLINNVGIYIDQIPSFINIMNIFKRDRSLFRRFIFYLYRHFGITFFLTKIIGHHIKQKYSGIISFMEGESLLLHQFVLKNSLCNYTWVHTDLISNQWTKNFFYKNDEELFYSKMDKIIFVSEESKLQFNNLFNIQVKQQVIYNLIDKQEINKLSNKEEPHKRKFTICTVGSLRESKRYDRLVKIASYLKRDNFDVDIWILGEGVLLKKLQNQVIELDVQDVVHFLGFKQPPYSYMKASDLFISTSSAEGFPLVVCEALCLGLPIVSTKTSGPMELLDNNKYGILTEHNDIAIYDGLKQMILSNEVRLHYSKMALKRSEMFDVAKTMQEIYQLFN